MSRLPATTRVGPVALRVPDLAASVAFYRDLLGMRVLRARDAHVELGADAPLVALEAAPGSPPRPSRSTGLYHAAILLPTRADLARVLRHLAQARYPLQGASDHAVSEALYLADPHGNGLEIYADRPREAWPRSGGRLLMTTGPLDVQDLLAHGEGAWRGMPDGTRIGHVHLQVDDAAGAERFWRDVVGFDLTTRYGEDASFLSAGGYHHHVAVNAWGTRGAPAPPPGALGLAHVTLALPDAAALAALAARLAEADRPARSEEGALVFTDPCGNGVRAVAAQAS